MKTKNYIITLFVAIGMFGTSCNDYLDVNTDPNNLSDLQTPEAILPVAQVGLGNQLMGWDIGFSCGIWSQYWTQNYTASQFKDQLEYQDEDFSTAYNDFYSYILNDLIEMNNLSEEGTGNYYVSELLSIYTWQMITDLWGDVPYTEALQGDDGLTSPVTDTQESIYTDLNLRIDALLSEDYSAAIITEEYDFIYAGEIARWIEFANTLKLKLMIRLSETSSFSASEALSFIESNSLITETAMISGEIWESQTGKQHPMVEFEEDGASYFSTNIIACKTFLDYLTSNDDPRLEYFYEPVDEVYEGAFNGDFDSKEDSDGDGIDDADEEYSTVEFESKSNLPILSLWEKDFYIAEIYARNANSTKAKEYYDLAVSESLTYWGIEDTITGDGDYAEWVDGTEREMIKQIAMQKWVAYYKLQHAEAFLERNRTKFPSVNEIDIESDRADANLNFPVGDFTISVKGRGKLSGNLPKSPIYPNELISRNTNSPSQKNDIGEAVWWDTRSEK